MRVRVPPVENLLRVWPQFNGDQWRENTSSGKDSLADLIFVHSGVSVISNRETTQPLSMGTVVLIPFGAAYQIEAYDDFHPTLIRFDPRALGFDSWDISRTKQFARYFSRRIQGKCGIHAFRIMRLSPERMEQAVALVSAINREFIGRDPGWRDLAMGHFQHLVILLCRFAKEETADVAPGLNRVKPAILHIEKHYNEPIVLAQLANLCKMTTRTFTRVFLSAVGQSSHAYLRRLRIKHSSEQLRMSDNPVSEIAFANGYEDANFFAREFRKAQGVSPTAYRRLWRV